MPETQEITARDELYELAERLREADTQEKAGKAVKDEVRGPFFELINEVVREEIPLQRQTVELTAEQVFDVNQWRAINYPEWRVVALDAHADGATVTLEENESFKKFEFNHNGFRYGRQIRMKGAGFDAEGFIAMTNDIEDDDVADLLLSCIEEEVITTYSLDEQKAIKIMTDHPELTAHFQEFTLPGVPEAAFLPIKASKEEEE